MDELRNEYINGSVCGIWDIGQKFVENLKNYVGEVRQLKLVGGKIKRGIKKHLEEKGDIGSKELGITISR